MDTLDDKGATVPEMIANLNLYGLIEDMALNPGNQIQRVADIKGVVETITERQKQPAIYKQANEGNRRGETVLHTAIKRLQFTSAAEKEVLDILADNFPKMLYHDRINTEYAGQTVLHMAVTKGNIWVANKLLKKMSTKEHRARKPALLRRLAVGGVFVNTVMMAELPLSIAAVTSNKGMFDLLIEHGAELDGTNRHGDNVCHSLVRYALLYPEKLQNVLDMCKYISEDPAPYDNGNKAVLNRKLRKKIWLMENEGGYNPLQLAAKFGQHEIFIFIMSLDVYCYDNVNDGLFDIKIYDVTEIDAVSYMTPKERTGLDNNAKFHKSIEEVPGRRVLSEAKKSCQKSTLQMLLQLEPGCAFQFLVFPPLRRIIDKKWGMYRRYFYPWFLFHFLYMCFLTWYGIERAKQISNTNKGFDTDKNPVYKRDMFHDGFGIAYGVIDCVIGTIYILEALIRLIKGRMSWTLRSFTNPYGNGTFQIMFVLFGLLLIIDFPLAIWVRSYENYLLLVAIILGWFLCLFFLRALRPFSFFTVMIQKVLIGDLFRFFVILSCELIGFSAAMYMAIQGTNDIDSDFQSFGRVIVSMFKLMFGLGEIGLMYNTRHPALVIMIFLTFIILTTVLMINSLIAMLSRTCTELVENVGTISARDMHWKLQRLSVVLYLESILSKCFVKCVGEKQETLRFNSQLNKRNKVTRYLMEIRSLQTEERDRRDDSISASWGFRTAQFNALLHRQAIWLDRPLSGIREKFSNFVHDRKRKHDKDIKEDNKDQKTNLTDQLKDVYEANRSPNKSKDITHYGNQGIYDPEELYVEDIVPERLQEQRRKDSLVVSESHLTPQPNAGVRISMPTQVRRIIPENLQGNQDFLPIQEGQLTSKYDKFGKAKRVYMRPTHVNQMQMADMEVMTHGGLVRARTTPIPTHIEEPATSKRDDEMTGESQTQETAHRSPSLISPQSPEKLEIYHISRCRKCSVNESIA